MLIRILDDDLILTALAAFDVNALERIQFRVPGLIRKLSIVSRQRTDDALVNLYDWFVQRGLSPGESELRAATISNEYWDTHFTITEDNSDGEKSRGCDAVRKRVQRRRTKRDALNTPS